MNYSRSPYPGPQDYQGAQGNNQPPSQIPPSAPAQPGMVRINLPLVRPYVTYAFIGLCVVVYILQLLSQNFLGGDYPAALGAKINEAIMAGQYWRLFTPLLLHGSILHIGFNMYALYIIGPGLERYYGNLRFFMLYMLGGFAGNVFSFWFSAADSYGASTAIFGLVVAEALFIYKNRFLFGNRAGAMIRNVVVIIIINLILGLSPGIDNWGHLGGLVGGAAFAWFAGPVFKVVQQFQEYSLVDERTNEDAWRMTIAVGAAITVMAAVKIWFKF